MKHILTLLVPLMLMACGGDDKDVTFEDLAESSTYGNSGSIDSNGVTIQFTAYNNDLGDTYDDGVAQIQTCGQMLGLGLANISAALLIPNTSSMISIAYQYLGGDINLKVNNELFLAKSFA